MTAVAFSFFATIGRIVLGFLATTGRVAQFTAGGVRHCVTPPWYPRLILRQMVHEGKIIWDGPVADIDEAGSEYVDQFIKGRADGPIEMEVLAL